MGNKTANGWCHTVEDFCRSLLLQSVDTLGHRAEWRRVESESEGENGEHLTWGEIRKRFSRGGI